MDGGNARHRQPFALRTDQQHNGSRALDIRLLYDPKAVGPSRFAMPHNGFRNSRTLDNLLTDINAFLGYVLAQSGWKEALSASDSKKSAPP
ncbi:hypothetical protein [Pseudomonas sp. VD-NE ext]|uniref:hypothetical protein n=1 Tax=Pseudomonas sp. VD-NE ext TaxID=3075583 RepID=UPI00289336C0|nr:hypothetical protein [Pseudomonas sp. VD-NE ext]